MYLFTRTGIPASCCKLASITPFLLSLPLNPNLIKHPSPIKQSDRSFECGSDQAMDFRSVSAMRNKTKKGKSDDSEEVEDACRSFEKYMARMTLEEGKLKDLMDVEEFLYCWRNLKCPLFLDLVSTFYGELCKDLFSSYELESETSNSL